MRRIWGGSIVLVFGAGTSTLLAGCADPTPPAPAYVQAVDPCGKYDSPTEFARCRLFQSADGWRFIPEIGRNADLDTQIRCAPSRWDLDAYAECIGGSAWAVAAAPLTPAPPPAAPAPLAAPPVNAPVAAAPPVQPPAPAPLAAPRPEAPTPQAPSAPGREFGRALPAPGIVLSEPLRAHAGAMALEPEALYAEHSDTVWTTVTAASFADLASSDVSRGSAVAVAPDRLLTNCHLFTGRNDIARIEQGEMIGSARLIAADFESDRCVLAPNSLVLDPVIGIRRYDDLRVGERAFTIGSPLGLERTLGEGLISRLDENGTGILRVQTTAPISPGSSGGGLFDGYGNLVGITTGSEAGGQQLNFAIAAESFWE